MDLCWQTLKYLAQRKSLINGIYGWFFNISWVEITIGNYVMHSALLIFNNCWAVATCSCIIEPPHLLLAGRCWPCHLIFLGIHFLLCKIRELWCWRRLLRVPWTARRSNQSVLKEISPGCSLEGLMLKLKLQYFGHLMRRVDSLERP